MPAFNNSFFSRKAISAFHYLSKTAASKSDDKVFFSEQVRKVDKILDKGNIKQEEHTENSQSGRSSSAQTHNQLIPITDSIAKQQNRWKDGNEGLGKEQGAQDAESQHAKRILDKVLRSRGAETFYKQPQTELTHAQAAHWISKSGIDVDKSVKESGDTTRLHKKFEKKLCNLVNNDAPSEMNDAMQDTIIESARILSEIFISKNNNTLVRSLLVSEMQKRGNEILIETNEGVETFFTAAQRLKKATTLEVEEPCKHVSYILAKKIDETMRRQSIPRKLSQAMKDHVNDAADYLSTVNKPDEEINAYVSLLNEMEEAGDNLLIEGDIPKSFKDSAIYLRHLISNQDELLIPNSNLQGKIEKKLKNLMSNVTPTGYSKNVLNGIITKSTKHLVSYIMLQGKKTDALKSLVDQMDKKNNNVLLRHGKIYKTYGEGADVLRSKNTDELTVSGADPVASRKIEIKLHNLMDTNTPNKHKDLIDDVIEDATAYLAVHLLKSQTRHICKCRKNALVQCELWYDEILRHVARPQCMCSRHKSPKADLAPDHISPDSNLPHQLQVSIKPCPARSSQEQTCSSKTPSEFCKTTTTYLLHSTATEFNSSYKPLQEKTLWDTLKSSNSVLNTESTSTTFIGKESEHQQKLSISNKGLLRDSKIQEQSIPSSTESSSDKNPSFKSDHSVLFWQTCATFHAKICSQIETLASKLPNTSPDESNESEIEAIPGSSVMTDEMGDWKAMMTNLLWNMQAWRDWIQEIINRALRPNKETEMWSSFQRRIATEALRWRQYNNFSRQLALQHALRYRDQTPTRSMVKTTTYLKCQEETQDIIKMFKQWTLWILAVIKDTNLHPIRDSSDKAVNELRWKYFKKKVEERVDDWMKYNTYLNIFLNQKYRSIVGLDLVLQRPSEPVWVVSASGTVPSGAVAAGMADGEVIWVARCTHNQQVLPAALVPSKHCCVVYADGAVHHYSKYQVLCNANAKWVACRADGEVHTRSNAVSVTDGETSSVTDGVLVGRVLYRDSHLLGAVRPPAHRCHVVIFSRHFDFSCYEILVLTNSN